MKLPSPNKVKDFNLPDYGLHIKVAAEHVACARKGFHVKYFVALGLALVLNASANILMKLGMKKIAEAGGLFHNGVTGGLVAIATSPALIIGMACFALNLGAYMFALQKLPISVAYPIMVTVGFAIIVVAAWWLFHERLNTVQWFGVAAILAGVWLVASQVNS